MTDVINVGTTDNDGNGDTLRAAFSQINTRFNELLSTIDGGDAWATGVTYTATPIRQWVINAGQAYVAAVNHVSGASFAADLSAGKWFAVDSAQILVDLAASTGAGMVGFSPTGTIASTTVQTAIAEINTDLAASSGASLVGYLPDGTGAVATYVQSKLRESVSVKDFGAVGDGVTDDTAAIQAALNTTFNNIYFPEGTYLFSNLTIPNRRITLFGDGHWKTTLKCASPTNTDYGVASSAYVNNATTGSEPVTIRDLEITGDNLVDYPLVIYGYFSEVRNSRVNKAKVGGRALKFTSNGISGSACSTTLVENKLIECTISGGDGDAYIVSDTGAKCTDMMVTGNIFSDGAVTMTSMAGHCVTDNHFYGGSVTLNKLSTGTVISNNYFENEVTLNDFKDEVVGLSGNKFVSRVSVDFGVGGEIVIFDGCLWQATADLYHNYFASDKHAVVNGGAFETATPVVFHNGASTGRVTFNRVWCHGLGALLEGTRTASTGVIRSFVNVAPGVSSDRGDASVTLTWGTSETTQRFSTTLTANRTITLSSTGAVMGAKFRIRRTGGGAFTLDVGGLKSLSASQWCDVEFLDGSGWILTAFGSL